MTSWGEPPGPATPTPDISSWPDGRRRWDDGATGEKPAYRVLPEQLGEHTFWMIEVSEGWRSLVLARGLYKDYADWLLTLLKDRPLPDAGQVTRRVT